MKVQSRWLIILFAVFSFTHFMTRAAYADDPPCGGNLAMDGDLGSALGPAVVTGTTVGAGNDFLNSTCGNLSGEDRVYLWTAPYDATYLFDAIGSEFPPALVIVDADNPGFPVYDCQGFGPCNYPNNPGGPRESMFVSAGTKKVIIIDDSYGIPGNFVINIEATERKGPGAAQQFCTDGIDNDHDGDIDTDDRDCICGGKLNIDSDLGSALGPALVTGTTVGAGNNLRSSTCGTLSGEDRAYTWTSPADGTYYFDAIGSEFPPALVIVDADNPGFDDYDCQGFGPCNYPNNPGGPQEAVFVSAGTKKVIIIDDSYGVPGNFVINISDQAFVPNFCGNQLCEAGEDGNSCPEDCGFCGDLICDPCVENAQSCASDCYCGDSTCDSTETSDSCPEDCLGSICGDLICDWNETCQEDCGENHAPACTGGTACGNGQLDPGEECDDGNTQNGDCCSDTCTFETNGSSCNDNGDVCDGTNSCQSGVCTSSGALNCNDNNACTTDSCDHSSGCQHASVSADDGNACTTDSCDPSTGVSHTPISCDDGNACTEDSCNPSSGCQHSSVSVDDSNACTADSCDPSTGVSHTPVSVDDSNACTTDSCDPSTGVSHTPVSVDDGNACTTDSCNSATGTISHTPISADDGNACTTDSCNPATGVSHTPVSVDDGNACTTDSCNPATGVSHTPINCQDGNACNGVETCNPTLGCQGGTALNCDDNDPCTADSCDSVTGCGHTPLSDSDGDGVCDANDTCPHDPNNDVDHDGICGDVDNCPDTANPNQADSDHDGIGDACEAEEDACSVNFTGLPVSFCSKTTTVNSMAGLQTWLSGPKTTNLTVQAPKFGSYNFGGQNLSIQTSCAVSFESYATFFSVGNVSITASAITVRNDIRSSPNNTMHLRAGRSVEVRPGSFAKLSVIAESPSVLYKGNVTDKMDGQVALCGKFVTIGSDSTLKASKVFGHAINDFMIGGNILGANQVTLLSDGSMELNISNDIGSDYNPIGNLKATVRGHFDDLGDIVANGTSTIQTGSFTLYRSHSFDVDGQCKITGTKTSNSRSIQGKCVPGIQ